VEGGRCTAPSLCPGMAGSFLGKEFPLTLSPHSPKLEGMSPSSLVLNIHLRSLNKGDAPPGVKDPGLEIRFVFGCIQWLAQKEALSRGEKSAEPIQTRLHFILESALSGEAGVQSAGANGSPHSLFLKEFLDEFCRLRAAQCSHSTSKFNGPVLEQGEQARDLEFDLIGQEDLSQLPQFLNCVDQNPHSLVLGSSPFRGKAAWLFSHFRAWPALPRVDESPAMKSWLVIGAEKRQPWTATVAKLIKFRNTGSRLLVVDLDSSDAKKPRVPLRCWGEVLSSVFQ
jgi:hypothetical protein